MGPRTSLRDDRPHRIRPLVGGCLPRTPPLSVSGGGFTVERGPPLCEHVRICSIVKLDRKARIRSTGGDIAAVSGLRRILYTVGRTTGSDGT